MVRHSIVSNELLIRADAGLRMGTGHVMRCLALAQAWQTSGGSVTFITACDSQALRNRLLEAGFALRVLDRAHPDPADWENSVAVLAAHPGAWVVLDGYHFDPVYHQRVREAGHPLLVIDDLAHLAHYEADILLNQNINAEALAYHCAPNTTCLLGPQYVLLRPEFWPWRTWRRETPAVGRKVLVTLGGSDPDNQTAKVVRALAQLGLEGVEVVVVVGASNPHLGTLQALADQSPLTIRLARNVTDMPELMAWADVAISAGGSTCWELAFMGVPSLVGIIADNQVGIAEALASQNVARNVGWFETLGADQLAQTVVTLMKDEGERVRISQAGRRLVDGQGAQRIGAMLRAYEREYS